MFRFVAFVGVLFLFGSCGKEVAPDYLKALQARADGICACVKAQPKLPTKTVDGAETYDVEPAEAIVRATHKCIGEFGDDWDIKTPTGEAVGLYQESLDEDSQKTLQAISDAANDCEEIHLKQWRAVVH